MPSSSKHYVISCYHYYINDIFPGLLFILCCLGLNTTVIGVSQVVLVVKNPPANAGDMRDVGSIPGLGRSPGGGHGNPSQYSCLENPHGQRSLAGYSPWGCKESDMTDAT